MRACCDLVLAVSLLVTACGGSTFSTDYRGDGGPASGGASGGTPSTGGSYPSGAPGDGGRLTGGQAGLGGHATGGRVGSGGAVAAGGAPNTTLLAKDYDQSCVFDYECSLVTEGSVCGCHGCPNATISTTALPKWNADSSAVTCLGPIPPCPPVSCASVRAVCAGGTCGVYYPIFVDGSQYDQTCSVDSDCVLVPTGDPCSVCRCSTAGINKSALPAYTKDVSTALCNPGPSPCDCMAPNTTHCERSDSGAGHCAVGFGP